jgi:predicted regulator of Ras-like GTPase activity (Roadblock/LC7/MglB family)
MGLLLNGSGVVSAAAGNPGVVDPVTFASLASAYALAAGALAPLAAGAEFSQLVQEGHRSRIVLAPVGGDGVLALLTSDDAHGGLRAVEGGPDVTELNQALAGLRSLAGDEGRGGVGSSWVQAAESQIDRIFRGGR